MAGDERQTASKRPGPRWLLRPADQLVVGGLTLAALVALGGYWISLGCWQGRLIELETAPSQSARFLVDINQADWPELAELPGVGETIAADRRNAAS